MLRPHLAPTLAPLPPPQVWLQGPLSPFFSDDLPLSPGNVSGCGPERLLSGCGPGRLLSGCGPGRLLSGCGPERLLSGCDPGRLLSGCGPGSLLSGCSPGNLLSGCGPGNLLSGCGPGMLLGGCGLERSLVCLWTQVVCSGAVLLCGSVNGCGEREGCVLEKGVADLCHFTPQPQREGSLYSPSYVPTCSEPCFLHCRLPDPHGRAGLERG